MNFMGSTARTVAMTSSVLCLRPVTVISPSRLPQTKTRPPGPRNPSRPVRANSWSPYGCTGAAAAAGAGAGAELPLTDSLSSLLPAPAAAAAALLGAGSDSGFTLKRLRTTLLCSYMLL